MSETQHDGAADAPRLADGTAPAGPGDLFARLEALGIAAASFEHPAVHTVEEAKALRGTLAGADIKKLLWLPTLDVAHIRAICTVETPQ